jgi:cysteine desulfurase/selenocysteine lyase
VAVSAVSNVLGTINPVAEIVDLGHQNGSLVLVDAAQHTPHDQTDVQQWQADFVCFSGHKMLGPSGVGILYGRQELLEAMPPFMGGGSMISAVTVDGFVPGELPVKFEAGTPPIAQVIGLAAAIDYLQEFGLTNILQHERELTQATMDTLSQIDGLTILGPGIDDRGGIVSFVIDGLSCQDLAILLDRRGVAVRAGHHCAMPLHDYLGIRGSCRASYYLYNTLDEVYQFGESLLDVVEKLR